MTEKSEQSYDVKPLLTLAIPTYNRARFLRELLSVLFDQLSAEPRVELIISDNASPDETPAVVKEFIERGLTVRYIRNQTNVGPDANFLQCFEQARGKYVWIFGDDDVLVTDAISSMIRHLESGEYDLAYVNAYLFEGPNIPRAANPCRESSRITDPLRFARRIHIHMTFISCNIINKDRLSKSTHPPFSGLVGTNLLQLGWTLSALNHFVNGLFIHEQLVGVRGENRGGYIFVKIFGPTFTTITSQWLQSTKIRRSVINATLRAFWPAMLLEQRRSPGRFEEEGMALKVLSRTFEDNLYYWTFVYPVLVMPLTLARCWLFAERIVNRIIRLGT